MSGRFTPKYEWFARLIVTKRGIRNSAVIKKKVLRFWQAGLPAPLWPSKKQGDPQEGEP
jgi:hypothetical protein